MGTRVMAVTIGALLLPWTSLAQAPRLPRADGTALAGWLHSDVSTLNRSMDDWTHAQGTLGAEVGLYWTEHHKTELSVERSNTIRVWFHEEVPVGRQIVFRSGEHQLGYTRVSLGQYYQFGHNAFAHVAVGGGLTVSQRRVRTEVSPVVIVDRTGQRLIEPSSMAQKQTESTVSAFAAAVFKGYFTERVFFRSDLQADFRSTLDHVVLRAGIGVDF